MIRANEVNSAQVALIKNIAEGGVDFPKTNYELSELVKKALLLRDHNSDEAEAVKRSKIQFIKTVKQKADKDGWVYLSVVKNVLSRRSYFRNLVRSQSVRDLDAMRSVSRELIELGVIKRVDNQVMLTETALDYLSELEAF